MRTLIVFGLIAATGCGHSASDPSASDPSTSDAGTDSDADAVPLTYDCADDARGETYTVGDEHTGVNGTIDVKLMSAEPAPPARGNNTWVIALSSMANGVVGAPMDVMTTDITVTPYMPDHGHGTAIAVEVTPVDGQSGQYTLTPLNLWMPGLWQTYIQVNEGSATDQVSYSFCLPD